VPRAQVRPVFVVRERMGPGPSRASRPCENIIRPTGRLVRFQVTDLPLCLWVVR
jgi:hypothetical protein